MDDADGTPLKYHDRHGADRSPAPESGPRFFTWIDLFGMLLPVWLVLLALAIGTPIVAVTRGAAASGRYAIGVGVYGGISSMFFILPYAAGYSVWRIAGVIAGRLPVLLTALAGLALSLGAVGLFGGDSFWFGMFVVVCLAGVIAGVAQSLALRAS